MTNSLEVPRTLSDRLNRVREVFAPVGASPSAAANMLAADEEVSTRLEDLAASLAEPSTEDLEAAGEAWAKGKGLSKAKAALSAPVLTAPRSTGDGSAWQRTPTRTAARNRLNTIIQAASRTLLESYDLPEYSTATLVADCAEQTGEYLAAVAAEATRTLDALPTSTLEQVNAGRVRLSALDELDMRAMSVEQITAHRDAAAAWATVHEVQSGGVTARNAWEAMFRAVATGSLAASRDHVFPEGPATGYALWFDAPGCAALAAGYKVPQVLTEGLGALHPVADPFNVDAEVFRHRLDAYNGVSGWAETLDNVVAAQLYKYEPLLSRTNAVRKSYRDYNELERAGFPTPAAALSAYLDARPQFRTDGAEQTSTAV